MSNTPEAAEDDRPHSSRFDIREIGVVAVQPFKD
jgi:hypothetical protein